MLDLLSTIILFASFFFNSIVVILYFIHMFQLNSYVPSRYFKWARINKNQYFPKSIWLLLAIVSTAIVPFAKSDWKINFICAGIFILFSILFWPEKSKKPLVITARIKRLITTYFVLTIAVSLIVYLTGKLRIGISALYFWVLLSPISILFANLINYPMEKGIAKYYINDAISILSKRKDLIIIGITGSYGKTSTKNILHSLLSVKHNVLMTPESYNTTMGVVRTVREQLLPSHEIFIVEMGAKNKGDIKEICDLVKPQYGIITSIGEQHLETFKSIKNIIDTKFELVNAIPSNGKVFLNIDNNYIKDRKHNADEITYSILENSKADYIAKNINVDSSGSTFNVTHNQDDNSLEFTTKLLGKHNIQNIIGSIAVANSLGISLQELIVPTRQLKPIPHRLQLLPNGYIDDAYNSNPVGFKAALDVLSQFEGQRVLVTPGMVELGDLQDQLNKEMGAYAANKCDWAVLVGKKQAPPLKEGLLEEGFEEENIFVAENLQEALDFVNQLPKQGNRTVLLENDLPDNY